MQRFFLLILLPVIVQACAPEPGREDTPRPFFDLEGYITTEAERLAGRGTRVEKTITLNGKTETRELDKPDFANDLRLFREADINKPAWFDKYATEEKALSAGHKITTYLAQDSSLIVRRLRIEQDQGVPIRVDIERHTGTVLSDGRHRLSYEPARGYEVVTSQQNRFGEDVEAVIRVRW